MHQTVISASRRTDIPAFYMPWFMAGIDTGYFEVQNPYNHHVTRVDATIDQVHSIVFWSKNFGPFLDLDYGRVLVDRGYRLFFNFTINSEQSTLEPAIPPLEQRLAQLERLVETFGPDCVQWRLDPICFFRERSGLMADNLNQFEIIARQVYESGVRQCITSFVDLYRKVQRRINCQSDLVLIDPPLGSKVDTIARLAEHLFELDIDLRLCCEKDLLAALPPGLPVGLSACIPSDRLAALFGPGISTAKDSGQRRSAGCGCGVSKDIGSYNLHPCRHNCLFCYANPACDAKPANMPAE
jgi:Domain of unknown function (DUF1848)